jgi:type IV secretion system protein VirD4
MAGLCLCLLWYFAAMSWGCYRAAAYYGFSEALGKPLFSLGRYPVYQPFAVSEWQKAAPGDKRLKAINDQSFMFAMAAPMLLGLLYVIANSGLKGREDLHGSARWAKKEDIAAMGYIGGEGVYVGGWWDSKQKRQIYLRHNGPEHILVFAPTRSGKGVGLILPTLLAWPHSSVVLDIKGENYALTSGYSASLGHKCLRFDPSDPDGASAAFNPFEEIELDSALCIPDVQRIASMIMDPNGKGLEDYWNKAAFGFLGGALLHCLVKTRFEQGRTATFLDLAMMLEDPAVSKEEPDPGAEEGKGRKEEKSVGVAKVFDEMLVYDHAAKLKKIFPAMPDEFCKSCQSFIGSAAAGMKSKADSELSGVVNTATANLALYKDPVVALNTSRCDFRLHDLMNADVPVNLYLVVSPADIDRLRPLLRIFLAQLLNKITGRMDFENGSSVAKYKHRLLLLLDEFTSLGKIAIVERAIAYMAGYGVKGYFIVQDTKQLNQAYGADNALMANCHIRIAYAPNLAETAEYLSKMLGTTTVVDQKTSISRSKGGASRSISVSETSRPLLTPGECMTLPGMSKDKGGSITPGDMLIITAGNHPIYGRQILYFIDPVFSERAKFKAPGVAEGWSRGLSHSLYWPMPIAYGASPLPVPPKEETAISASGRILAAPAAPQAKALLSLKKPEAAPSGGAQDEKPGSQEIFDDLTEEEAFAMYQDALDHDLEETA